jgi:hypothetical protein
LSIFSLDVDVVHVSGAVVGCFSVLELEVGIGALVACWAVGIVGAAMVTVLSLVIFRNLLTIDGVCTHLEL